MSDIDVSRFQLVSIGIALSNVDKNGDEITVLMLEKTFGLNDEINHEQKDDTVVYKDHDEESVTLQFKTSGGVKAKWMRMSQPNRATAPNIRRGAKVLVYQFDKTDKYFWEVYENNARLMATEHIVYRFKASNKDDQEPSLDNCYWFAVSTVDRQVIFETSKANGEKTKWHLSFDNNTGLFTVRDENGTGFQIDSLFEGGLVRFCTSGGGSVELENRKLIIDVDEIVERAKIKRSEVDETEVTGKTLQHGLYTNNTDVVAGDISVIKHHHLDSHGALCSSALP